MRPEDVEARSRLIREMINDENLHKMFDEAEMVNPSLDGQIRVIPEVSRRLGSSALSTQSHTRWLKP